jgi:hypothetical protein
MQIVNYYENVIVILVDPLNLYACIVKSAFKNYLWKPFNHKLAFQKKQIKNHKLNFKFGLEKTIK